MQRWSSNRRRKERMIPRNGVAWEINLCLSFPFLHLNYTRKRWHPVSFQKNWSPSRSQLHACSIAFVLLCGSVPATIGCFCFSFGNWVFWVLFVLLIVIVERGVSPSQRIWRREGRSWRLLQRKTIPFVFAVNWLPCDCLYTCMMRRQEKKASLCQKADSSLYSLVQDGCLWMDVFIIRMNFQ